MPRHGAKEAAQALPRRLTSDAAVTQASGYSETPLIHHRGPVHPPKPKSWRDRGRTSPGSGGLQLLRIGKGLNNLSSAGGEHQLRCAGIPIFQAINAAHMSGGDVVDPVMMTAINPKAFCKDRLALLPSPLQRRPREVKASLWQGFSRGSRAWLRQQEQEAEMGFMENKSLSQHVNEDLSVQVAFPRHRYGIKTQTFKNQRDLPLLLVSIRYSVLGSLFLPRLSPANTSCNGLSCMGMDRIALLLSSHRIYS